ncbi:MAG TPA: carboxypeptidase-like regulatory domain-containing protein, partial [Acidobacteriaceae bacterium]|nr:carboxypeptidase-like regulatory domain-containing protein [Acidobacteriaceae bacterium]
MNPKTVITTVVDENGVPVNDARVTIHQQGQPDHHLVTDYAGRVWWVPLGTAEYTIRVDKSGFYQTVENAVDPTEKSVRLMLTHEQIVQQEVNVNASAPGLDPQQVSDQKALNLPEITNVPFPLDRDIRTLLPFTPQVIGDVTGQVHVAGGETYMTLDTLDGFDIRSPVFGTLDMRVSTDAVRSVDTETTRYPVEY